MNRGFAFSLDAALGVVVVILFIALFSHVVYPPAPSSHAVLQVQAKDAVVEWFYSFSSAIGNPPLPPDKDFACSTGFRPVITQSELDPVQDPSWIFQTRCVVAP